LATGIRVKRGGSNAGQAAFVLAGVVTRTLAFPPARPNIVSFIVRSVHAIFVMLRATRW